MSNPVREEKSNPVRLCVLHHPASDSAQRCALSALSEKPENALDARLRRQRLLKPNLTKSGSL